MIILFFKKLKKFMYPVRTKQMLVVDNSVGPQKEQLVQ